MNSGGLWLLPSLSLAKRDIVRFFRQRSRVIGALVFPLVIWGVIGSGIGTLFHETMAPSGQGYLEYLFPGTLAMILLFTGIFSTVSVIEDRTEGFLQAVLVAPIHRGSIVLGSLFGASVLATIQAMLFVILAPLVGFSLSFVDVLLLTAVLFYVSFGLAGAGFLLAWKVSSVQGYHALMNIILFPMWLLSGAVFPAKTAPLVMTWLMKINPLHYGLALIRYTLYGERSLEALSLPSVTTSLVAVTIVNLIVFALALRMVEKKRVYA